jgi:uncharacterized lipoprotein YajG
MSNFVARPLAITLKLALVLAIIVLTGCASGPKIYANQDPSADFSQFKTYGYTQLDTDTDRYGSLLSQYMKTAASRELEARGYSKSDNPDLLVNFHIHTQEKIKTTQTPTSSAGYYGYRGYGGGYGGWGGYGGYETQVTQYTEGTVNVDLIDKKRSQLVWEVALVGRVTDKARENLEATVDEVMLEVFLSYPYIAGSNVPQPPPE